MKKILITGYCGFIGTNLVNSLSGYKLIGVDLHQNSFIDEHFDWSQIGNILEVDCIIHLAGKAHDTEKSKDFQDYYTINLDLTKEIFYFFLKSSATKFVYFSSVAAVTDSLPPGVILTEESVTNPLTHYGKSKLDAEKFINGIVLPPGKLVYILRPSMVHGPGNRGNLPLLFAFVQRGIPWPLGAYKNKRTFTYIKNLLFVIKQLIERDIEPGTYQVVDDDAITTNVLVRTIMDSLGKPVHIWNIPPFIINILAKFGDLFVLPINSFRLKKLTTSFEVSNKKIKKALEIDHMPYETLAGLKMSIEELVKDLQKLSINETNNRF